MNYSDRRRTAAGPKEDPEGLYLIEDGEETCEPVVDEEEADYFKELQFE